MLYPRSGLKTIWWRFAWKFLNLWLHHIRINFSRYVRRKSCLRIRGRWLIQRFSLMYSTSGRNSCLRFADFDSGNDAGTSPSFADRPESHLHRWHDKSLEVINTFHCDHLNEISSRAKPLFHGQECKRVLAQPQAKLISQLLECPRNAKF